MKRIITAVLCLMMVAAALTACGNKTVYTSTTSAVAPAATTSDEPDNKEAETVSYEPKSTDALIDINDVPAQDLSKVDADYQNAEPVKGEEIVILHTSCGDISLKFFPEVAPKAVESFKALVKAGRYDGTIFHRVIGNFMIQGGDYTNYNGTGGESAFGTNFGYETSEYVKNLRGTLAMAHSSLPDSNGSQFYINQVDNAHLDGGYTVFGRVIDGLDVVDAIAAVDTDYNNKPLTDVVLSSAEITTY